VGADGGGAQVAAVRGDSLEVSDQLGFAHPNSFRRAFRSAYGMAPLKFLESRVMPEG
jgi:AraC-like DNA-binding protein